MLVCTAWPADGAGRAAVAQMAMVRHRFPRTDGSASAGLDEQLRLPGTAAPVDQAIRQHLLRLGIEQAEFQAARSGVYHQDAHALSSETRPSPVDDFRSIRAILVGIVDMIDDLVLQPLLDVGADGL